MEIDVAGQVGVIFVFTLLQLIMGSTTVNKKA